MRNDDDIEHIYLDEEEATPPSAHHHKHAVGAVDTPAEKKKFYKLLVGILLVATLLSVIRGWDINRAMADFMAVFFITFASFKFYDIETFAHTYRTYDLIAARIRPWAYAVPFIEAFLGFWYLLSSGPAWLNILTLLFTGSAGWGVYKSLKQQKSHKFMCACLGRFIRLPLSKVSLVEDFAMFGMAALMLVASLL